jgi:hypothetical protein
MHSYNSSSIRPKHEFETEMEDILEQEEMFQTGSQIGNVDEMD